MNWTAAFVGFILAVILSNLFGYFFGFIGISIGLFIAGIVVGLMVGGGVLTGFGNGLVAGAFGAIVISIILLNRRNNNCRTSRIHCSRSRINYMDSDIFL